MPYLRRFGLGVLCVCTSTRRVNVAPLLPAGETLVSCRTFDTLFVRSELKSCFWSPKRTSLLPVRSAAVPRLIEPSSACSLPSPLEKTASRRSRVLEDTRTTSGAYTWSSGAGSLVGAEMTEPITCAPGGGSLAVAGFVLNTVIDPLTVNRRPSRPNESFGSERYASGLPVHVFHGTVVVALEPETVNGWALAPLVFA